MKRHLTKKINMKTHEMTHTGEKTFACSKYNTTFGQALIQKFDLRYLEDLENHEMLFSREEQENAFYISEKFHVPSKH